MKHRITRILKLSAIVVSLAANRPSALAQLTIPYADGSDGALIVSSNTVIDLSQAVTGSWTNNNTANSGKGVYDPVQWAVVFKYSSVSIASNATLTFLNHITHAPVVWLVSNNVTINGTLSLDGQGGNGDPLNLTEPGPGGFRGGGGPLYGNGPGFGPGGGGGNGSYFGSYGNPQIIPLIGGSGGNGSGCNGDSGGGAILIAASGSITNNGYCHADGSSANCGYYGSGGAIRLVASQIVGNGKIEAIVYPGNNGLPGRIRLEANSVSGALTINPMTAGVAPANPPTIFPPTNAPTVTILSVGGLTNGLADPKAIMSPNTSADDITLVTTSPVSIVLQTQNFPTTGTVTVFVKPRNGAGQTTLAATYVSGNTNSALWQVNASFPYPAHTVIQARATY